MNFCEKVLLGWILHRSLIMPLSTPETWHFVTGCDQQGVSPWCVLVQFRVFGLRFELYLAGRGSCQFWGEEGPAVCPQSHQGLEKAAQTQAYAIMRWSWGWRWVMQVWRKCVVESASSLDQSSVVDVLQVLERCVVDVFCVLVVLWVWGACCVMDVLWILVACCVVGVLWVFWWVVCCC